MKIGKTDEKGFTLIEVIVTLVLVGITAALAGMWLVSVANGYLFVKMNMGTAQKAQLAMTRLDKEFTAISDVTAVSASSITYTRPDITAGPLTNIVSLNGDLLQLQLNGGATHTLTDRVSGFTLAFCDTVDQTSCPATWAPTRRFIEITLTLTGANNVQSIFTQRIAPRNL